MGLKLKKRNNLAMLSESLILQYFWLLRDGAKKTLNACMCRFCVIHLQSPLFWSSISTPSPHFWSSCLNPSPFLRHMTRPLFRSLSINTPKKILVSYIYMPLFRRPYIYTPQKNFWCYIVKDCLHSLRHTDRHFHFDITSHIYF